MSKGRKMIFNKEDIALLASSKTSTFDKEGPVFIQEKSDGFFKRTEGIKVLDFVTMHLISNFPLLLYIV